MIKLDCQVFIKGKLQSVLVPSCVVVHSMLPVVGLLIRRNKCFEDVTLDIYRINNGEIIGGSIDPFRNILESECGLLPSRFSHII